MEGCSLSRQKMNLSTVSYCRTMPGSDPAAYYWPQLRAAQSRAVLNSPVQKAPPQGLPNLKNHKQAGKLSGPCLVTKPQGAVALFG